MTNPQINTSTSGRYKAVSSATIYKMQTTLLRLLKTMKKQLESPLYEDMYSRLIHLNSAETQRLHASLEAGRTNSVFDFLSNGATRHWK